MGEIRLMFTFDDLARVMFGGTTQPLAEAVLSLQVLQQRGQAARYGTWRGRLRGHMPGNVRPLLSLVGPSGWVPDFLTPGDFPGQPEWALEEIARTPRRRLAAELSRLADSRSLPRWARSIADGDRDALGAVISGLTSYQEVAIAPHIATMRNVLEAERLARVTQLGRQGVTALLNTLHQDLQWHPPVLTLRTATSTTLEIDLAGRGLLITPMIFCGKSPRFLDGDLPVLAYPPRCDDQPTHPLMPGPGHRPGLAKALGASRAAVLETIVFTPGVTTAGLSSRTGISLASASEHASTLRVAGLISSRRDGNRVRHYATPAASSLVMPPIPAARA